MRAFLLCFIPLFVAVDPLGLLPVYVSVTAGFDARRRRRIVLQALPTAVAIGVVFFMVGRPLLRFMNIDVPDLKIAGGILLFVYAVMDLFMPGKPTVSEEHSLGIVPLATPLIVGPAVLTLGLVLVDEFGYLLAISALVANLAILAAMMLGIEKVMQVVPINAMRAISKVVDLLLAAIGVGFVRQGLIAALGR